MANRYSDADHTEGLKRFLELTEYQHKSFVTVESKAIWSTVAPTTVREAADFGASGLAGIVGVEVQLGSTTSCDVVLSDTILTGVTISTLPVDAIVVPLPAVASSTMDDRIIVTWPTAVTRRYCGIVIKGAPADTSAQYVSVRVLLDVDFADLAAVSKWYGMDTVAD